MITNEGCITSLTQLQKHITNVEKHEKYNQMLYEMGMNVNFFKNYRHKPSFVFYNQPGPWFSISYQIIINLLERLVDYFDCNQEISGVFALSNDRFTFGGFKKEFNTFFMANELKTLKFVDNKFISKNEGLAYPYVWFEQDDAEAIKSIFELAHGITSVSRKDFKQFERYIRKLPHEITGKRKRIDDFLPHGMDLHKLYDLLQLTYRKKMLSDFGFATDNIKEETEWSTYWNAVNEQVNEIKIKPAENILNQYTLAIEDVHKLANWLKENLNRHSKDRNPDQAIAIVNIIDPYSHKHYSVYYDFERAANHKKDFLYYLHHDKDPEQNHRQNLSWEEIINLADEELTSGPTYEIKYLLRAASHSYFMVDALSKDKDTKHDLILDDIHQEHIGLPYPWISFSASSPTQTVKEEAKKNIPDPKSLLALYSPFYEIEQSMAIADFFSR